MWIDIISETVFEGDPEHLKIEFLLEKRCEKQYITQNKNRPPGASRRRAAEGILTTPPQNCFLLPPFIDTFWGDYL